MKVLLIFVTLGALGGLATDWIAAGFMGISLASQWWHCAVAGAIGGTIGIGAAAANSSTRSAF